MAIRGSEQPTWKDAHDALSAYVTTLVCSMSAESRDSAFAHYTAIRDVLADAEDGSPTEVQDADPAD